jgi:hypothetical protein
MQVKYEQIVNNALILFFCPKCMENFYKICYNERCETGNISVARIFVMQFLGFAQKQVKKFF